ncbi:hypothetical protein M902_2767 [Bacteriovorax sp. BAL6_X]|uniref:hypothetical protein n=1 Tax=Bacteriovorax sp. BAL6_X TaxID=1201290 RepID=UPI00038569D6|nr:hypothetical protein [Bacteriovorax sp. BAL6_X]EPZ51001.1 hypothetical protein M902_2767 [Bacteriovorax sp. BAL6_X]
MFKRLQQAVQELTSEASTTKGPKERGDQSKKSKVLIISNNESITDRLSLVLNDTYDIVQRESISMIMQVFANVKKNDIELILFYDSDLSKDLSFFSTLRKYPRFSNIPIIVLAQEITEKRKSHYLENDLNDFIDLQSFPLIKQLANSKIKLQSKINSIINYSIDHNSGLDIVTNAQMHLRTLVDVASCARTLKLFTNATITQERAFFEIILNSLEHGQLKIDKKKRQKVKNNGDYDNYLDILCDRNKEAVIVTYEKLEDTYRISVIDGGDGFNFKKYLKPNLSNSIKETQKGIVTANSTKGIELKYIGPGNIVEINIPHQEKFKLWH